MKRIIIPFKDYWLIYKPENKEIINFPLYFFIDIYQQKITASHFYKMFYLQGKKNFVNNIYNLIEKQNIEINGKVYSLEDFFGDNISDTNIFIYEEKLSDINSKLENSAINTKDYKFLTNYILKHYLLNAHFSGGSIAVVQQIDNNLKISVFSLTGSFEKVEEYFYEGVLYDPMCYNTANIIIENIGKIYRSFDENEFNKERSILYFKVDEVVRKLQNVGNRITLSVGLSDQKRYIVNLSVEEVISAAEIYLRKIFSFIKNIKVGFTQLRKIILVGDFFKKLDLRKYFQNWYNKIYVFDYSKLFEYFTNNLLNAQVVNSIDIRQLSPGTKIFFTGFDNRKNKGYSYHTFEVIENGTLKVLESTRSLRSGDLILPKTDDDNIWENSKQVKFYVIRNNKKLKGYFLSRKISRLELFHPNLS